MKAAFETLDQLRAVRDCPDVDEGATAIMSPLWRGAPTIAGNPPQFQQWRKYELTTDTHEGCPLYREVAE